MRFIYRWVAFLFIGISLAACAQATATASLPTIIAPLMDTATPLPASTATPLPSPTAAPTTAALNLHPQVVVLATGLPEPDDLLLAPDRSILLSDVSDGTVKRYGRDGQLSLVVSGLNEPEGMLLAPDGSLIIAEQGNNRLVRYDFASK